MIYKEELHSAFALMHDLICLEAVLAELSPQNCFKCGVNGPL